MPILTLRGASALSTFRLDKLNARIGALSPGMRVSGAQFLHFVELASEPDAAERDLLARLLDYGDAAAAA